MIGVLLELEGGGGKHPIVKKPHRASLASPSTRHMYIDIDKHCGYVYIVVYI